MSRTIGPRCLLNSSDLSRISRIPNEDELRGPETIAKSTREMAERSLGEAALRTWRGLGFDFDFFCTCLRSYEPRERQCAEALFAFLLNLGSIRHRLFTTLKHLNRDAQTWGADALRLPDWDRDAWVAPLVELLGTEDVGQSTRRAIACQFRYLRKSDGAVPQELITLSETANGEMKSATLLAIRSLMINVPT
jgi:hypothetical protein